jgi:putative IMPACT (imprinted ancient) family translation regulator
MRRVIFPELLEAYNNYLNNNKLNNIIKVVYDKKEHWESQCIGLMNRYSNAESTVLELIHRDLQNQYQQ